MRIYAQRSSVQHPSNLLPNVGSKNDIWKCPETGSRQYSHATSQPTANHSPCLLVPSRVDLDRRVWLEGAGRLDDWFSNCAALTLETLRIPCVK